MVENFPYCIEKPFEVSRAHFRFYVKPNYEVVFELVSGMLRTGKWFSGIDEWGHRESGTQLFGNVKNPTGVVKAVLKHLNDWVRSYNPPYFTFSALEDERKAMYLRLAPRIEKVTGYKFLGETRGEFYSHFTFQKS